MQCLDWHVLIFKFYAKFYRSDQHWVRRTPGTRASCHLHMCLLSQSYLVFMRRVIYSPYDETVGNRRPLGGIIEHLLWTQKWGREVIDSEAQKVVRTTFAKCTRNKPDTCDWPLWWSVKLSRCKQIAGVVDESLRMSWTRTCCYYLANFGNHFPVRPSACAFVPPLQALHSSKNKPFPGSPNQTSVRCMRSRSALIAEMYKFKRSGDFLLKRMGLNALRQGEKTTR